MDFDPRWSDDSRGRDGRDEGRELSQGSRAGTSDARDRDSLDPRDVFMKDLDLPRGPERERVRVRDHCVTLRGSESRTLSTVGAFRVVPAGDLRDGRGKPLDPRDGDLKHLKREGLVQTIPVRGEDRALVVLTEKGREVLETHRRDDRARSMDDPFLRDDRDRQQREPRQEFHHGLQRPRELTHDAQVYRAYETEAERLREDEAVIRRVILDNELKSEYQAFLQERNRGHSDSDGRPDRTVAEIHEWAVDHELPDRDGHVQFPDARIEYEDRYGRLHTLDIEVETLNYRGAHSASKASSGFSRHNAGAMRVVGARGAGGAGGRRGGCGFTFRGSTGNRGGRPANPRIAEELLR
jgi:DNA-binding PadR family transcriptional regulator